MIVQWYPGHMTGARRMMQESMPAIDVVIELLDARVPGASKNPDIDTLAKGKSRVILLNKADSADPAKTALWKQYYEKKGFAVLPLDARNRKETTPVTRIVQEVCRDKIERDKRRGIVGRVIKAMIVGIPNVGKSTFINSFAGRSVAKTGNRPGVTKGKQWIRLSKDMDLLDTPGILWPKFEDPTVGQHLAWIGSVNDNILDLTELSYGLMAFLQKSYCNILADRYKITEGVSPEEALLSVAEIRKCLKKGGEPDLDKAARCLLGDLRDGRLGRITLEDPEE